MSWLKSAVSKAVEVGNTNNLTRTVKNYTDSFVQQAGQAVAEGAKILQDRIGARNIRSVRLTIKSLEEDAVSCRGAERAELMKRWLVVLKEIEKLSGLSTEEQERTLEQHIVSEEAKDKSAKPSLILYYDSDVGGEPMNFREVFLQSQALEGIALSMILEAPSEEEVSLLLNIFGLCLTGGIEVHNAVLSSIQDLATANSSYEDEVMVKREELLQFAQSAIAGLKLNSGLGRVDARISNLKKKLDVIKVSLKPSYEGCDNESGGGMALESIETLKEALVHIRMCSRLEELLLKKKSLYNGDSPESHAQKVDKLKVLLDSLSSSRIKSEKRIADNRLQKEEALKVRVARSSEVSKREKEIAIEISELEKQRVDLEAQLKKVNISLAAANARLQDTREERDQFQEANNHMVIYLRTKEDELLKTIDLCGVEADVLKTWINFLEDTWNIHCLYTEKKEKEISEELERHEAYFVNLAIHLLSTYKKALGPSISTIRNFVENLKNLSERSEIASALANDEAKVVNPRNNLEEEYLDYEAKIVTTFSVVDRMKEQFSVQHSEVPRKGDEKVQELFDDIEKLRTEFESIERPNLEMETPTREMEDTPSGSVTQPILVEETKKSSSTAGQSTVKTEQVVDPLAELAKLVSEFGNVGQDYSAETLDDWDFDELERELRAGDSTTGSKT